MSHQPPVGSWPPRFEKDLYFENAVIDIRALPKLEGTDVHINMALIVKFM
jgi:acyl-CoA dehydrogenase